MGSSFSRAKRPIPADPSRASAATKRYRRSGSSTSHNKAWKHDVFLSFRGDDTRPRFTSHLHHLLKDRGVDVFIDDGLKRGEDISSQLTDTIRSSRISVVIFSKNYGESGWCLQELVEIMECKNKSPGQMVLPVFYDTSPSDVRKQTGDFGKAFAKHRHNTKVARWRAALTEAASLSGWDMTNPANGTEAETVREIAQAIHVQLNNTYLDVAKYSIGLEKRMMPVNEQVSDGSNDVRFIVISGIGGVGKTTLAKAVYNQFVHTFEASCFLANIGENSKQPNGLIHLQEQLLGDILFQKENNIGCVDRGSSVIKERVRSIRVLVILDDLTHRDQINALARDREWFGPGSRIIITTRDPDSAKEIKPDFIYPLEGLDDDESLRLFSMHAFGSSHPKEGFTELSKRVVGYCEGLPLALEVLGALLLDKSREEWENELCKLRRTPNDDIQKRLEISYDALGKDEKELFLHIACFFVGWNKLWVSRILEACEFEVKTGLGILIRRKLVRVEYHSEGPPFEIWVMHDLIRDMGKEIVRRKSRNPGERSMLFSYDDIRTTLRSELGTKEVEGLVMPFSMGSELITDPVGAEAFAGMKRLRMLGLTNIHVTGDYGHFSKELRWLHWEGFPLESLPDEFYMGNMVIMSMRWSKLRALWRTSKILEHLKHLYLSHSHFLDVTPDFSNLPNLEVLYMVDCRSLKEIDASIGHLKRLLRLFLKGCEELESLPDSICRVKSLQLLDISSCSKIKQLPDDFGELTCLTHFVAARAPIAHLPPSIANFKNLLCLGLHGSSLHLSFVGFGTLVLLHLNECNLADGAIVEGIGSLQLLKHLDLRKSIFRHLPDSISSLPYLEVVVLNGCPELESVPVMPRSVFYLACSNCPKLKEASGSRQTLLLDGCHNLSLESRQSILQDWWGRFLVITGKDMELEYMSLDTPLSFQFCHRCEVHRILFHCCLSLPNYQFVQTNPQPYLALSSGTRRIDHVELEYFGPGKDNIYIFPFEPKKFMGGREYRGVSVALHVVPNPRVSFKGIKMYFDRERCPSCCCEQENPSVQEAIPEETVLDEQFQLSVEWSDTPRRGIASAIFQDVHINVNSCYGL